MVDQFPILSVLSITDALQSRRSISELSWKSEAYRMKMNGDSMVVAFWSFSITMQPELYLDCIVLKEIKEQIPHIAACFVQMIAGSLTRVDDGIFSANPRTRRKL